MTSDLLDEATREARERLIHTGDLPAPRLWAHVYAEAIMRLVEVGRCRGEDFYDAYRRVRERPTATLAALVLIHRDQFGREHRPVVH
ncbi:MAG: hypothetical protein V3U03_01100 [Myxococcota bacterium]